MQIIKGSKKIELKKEELENLIKDHNETVIDLGTGDGRFVFKQAQANPNNLYIGIDPSEKQLQVFSKEANKKRLTNALFILGSIELLPEELNNTADQLYINLPWGTLLQSIVNPTKERVQTITNILKNKGTLEITLGYHEETEPTETERLELPKLTDELIKEVIYPTFEAFGDVKLEKFKQIDQKDLKKLNTSWGNKLTFGKERPVYRIIFKKS